MITGSQIVDDILISLNKKIRSLKEVVIKRQNTIRQLDLPDSLKYTKLVDLKKIENPSYDIKVLIRCKESINLRYSEIKRLEKSKIPDNIMLLMFKAYNKQIQRDVLLGEVAYLGIKVGSIRTVLLKRKFSLSKRRIDWDKSFYVLEHIASESAPLILDKYKQKHITRNQFIEEMKPYVYSAAKPNLPKWLVDHLDDLLPYIKHRFNKVSKNYKSYVFMPTNFINNAERSQVVLTDGCKTMEEIIDSPLLGTRDKLFGLCRFNDDMIQNYVDVKYY